MCNFVRDVSFALVIEMTALCRGIECCSCAYKAKGEMKQEHQVGEHRRTRLLLLLRALRLIASPP